MRNKTIFLFVIAVLALGLTACGSALAQGVEPTQPITPSIRTLTVNGSAQAFLTPDIAYISVGVESQDADASQAVAANNAQAAQVIQRLKDLGIADRDIRTNNFSIFPSQEYDRDGLRQGTIFIVSNTVQVTVRNLSNLGDILDASVEAGANNIYGIQFDVADKTAALKSAREGAIANAQELAGELADAAGVTLGPVHSISFYGSAPIGIYERAASKVAMDMAVPIETGEMSIIVDVNMTFEIQ
jgi:uncharacterized protein